MSKKFFAVELTDDELNKLPTPRLLTLYKNKRTFIEDWMGEEDIPNRLSKRLSYGERIKAVLNQREHVDK